MTARYIDGKATAADIRAELRNRVDALRERGVVPGLAVILASDDPASKVYVRNKEKACAQVGIASRTIRLQADAAQSDLMQTIEKLNADPSVHGILLQLPTYAHLDSKAALSTILPEKDVDGFHPVNAGKLFLGEEAPAACTPAGCMELLRRTGISLNGKRAVVLGRSNIVGKPMAAMLLQANCTVTVCHSKTENLSAITREADILVAAIGKPKFVTAEMVKSAAVVLDVGINRLADGTLCGDVDTDDVARVASYITPVPGGVGPMTIAMLLVNTVKAAEKYAE
ncbi:MAG: bifunctional methylenetetrahydrofolate dehydrogenase/methenyltetrahydrofolate cyclohydrolase FolD [Clostridia bacterium]|nr:bifunctional methylenetetrahydrofolate dehydrogenase/methenyltetrahydrofolate cyclohydrolase FolD [Clostridia bacterium]